jgi:hypothetical protein
VLRIGPLSPQYNEQTRMFRGNIGQFCLDAA